MPRRLCLLSFRLLLETAMRLEFFKQLQTISLDDVRSHVQQHMEIRALCAKIDIAPKGAKILNLDNFSAKHH